MTLDSGPVTSDLSLARGVEGLDAEWLSVALAGAVPAGARVVGVAAETIGDGKIGSNVRLRLEWSPAGAGPASVVAKLPSTDPVSRATGVALGIYVLETRFYQSLSRAVGARVPHCHAALFDESSGDFVLILEDLSPAQVGDQLTGCSPAEARAALDELALLHASHWGGPLPGFAPQGLALRAAEIQPFFAGLVDAFSDKYRRRLAPEVLEVIRRFGDEMGRWGVAASAGPSVLLHGDYRLDNLLFGPDRVAAVDWQMVATGPPMSDTAYFVGAGLLPPERRAHEAELLSGYHARLVAAAPAAGGWGFDECRTSYRLNSLGGLIMAVTAAMMVGEGERSDEMFAVMAERHALHALDCEAFELLASVSH